MRRVMGLPTALQYVVFGLVIVGGMLVSGDRIIRGVEHVLRDRRRRVVAPAQSVGGTRDGPG
jgi:predicted PurR-regulated permease PerM